MILVEAVLLSFVLATVVALAVDVWVRRRGHGRAVLWFRLALYCALLWSVGSLVQFAVDGAFWKVAMLQVWSVPSWATPFAWFVFVLYYTGSEHYLTRGASVALGSLYVFLAGFSLTNHLHGLIWTDIHVTSALYSSPVLVADHGPLYLAGLVVTYLLFGLSMLLLARLFLTARRISRGQVAAIGLGVMAPIALNTVSVGADQYVPALNLTPVGIGVFLVCVGWALFRYQLFGIEPQARAEILEVIEEGVVVVDSTGLVVDYNDRATALFPTLSDSIGDPLSVAAPSLLAEADASGTAMFAESLATDTPADERSIRVSVSELTTAGERRAYVLVCQDVTELTAYATELEQRTEQLDRFAETVSHDLRNPLSVLQGNLELIEATGDTSHVEAANVAADRMSAIIDDVLTLARQGRSVEDPALVGLADVATEAWQTTDAPNGSLELHVPDDCYIMADEPRLRTALENLFRNAADHATPATDGGAATDQQATVTITIDVTDDGFFVADDGPGIPDDERDAIFEHGYTTAEDGTGFGLAIVQEIAQAHGWSVRVTSSDSGGAQFTFAGLTFAETPA